MSFTHHQSVDLVVASPLRRTIQTAAHAFKPALDRPSIQLVLLPQAQEIASYSCNIGHSKHELQHAIPHLLPDDASLDEGRIVLDLLDNDWNSKVSCYKSHHRSSICRKFYSRSEARYAISLGVFNEVYCLLWPSFCFES